MTGTGQYSLQLSTSAPNSESATITGATNLRERLIPYLCTRRVGDRSAGSFSL